MLEAAVAKAGKAVEGRAQGIALHQSFGSIVAQVAEVSVADGHVQVHRISCAIDCGRVINPLGVTQQIESAIAYGLSAALQGEIRIRDGRCSSLRSSWASSKRATCLGSGIMVP